MPTTPDPQHQPQPKQWPAGGVGGANRAAPNAEQVREQLRLFLILLLGPPISRFIARHVPAD